MEEKWVPAIDSPISAVFGVAQAATNVPLTEAAGLHKGAYKRESKQRNAWLKKVN